jgi:hypothetical protein
MKTYVQAHGFDVLQLVVYRYKELATPPTNNNGKKLSQNNLRDKNDILNGMVDSIYFKVTHCDSTKEI